MVGLLAFSAMLFRPADPLPHSTRAADAQIAADLKRHGDAAALAAHPGLAARTGRVLRIGEVRFVDEGVCDGSGCERYRFDQLFPGGYAGVIFERDESSDYWLIKAPVDATAVGAAPIASPSGRRLFVGFLDELSGNSATGLPSSIAIWQRDRPGPGLSRLRLVDVPIVAFDHFVAWHGDGCVEFVGVGDYGAKPATRSFWLVEERLDWVVHDTAPADCAGQ